MKLYFIFYILLLFVFIGCKKTEVSGVVYSKHGIPVPSANIHLVHFFNSRSPVSNSLITTTNSNGYYYFSFKGKLNSNHYYVVGCTSDSGVTNNSVNIKLKQSNKIDFHFQ